MATTNIVSFDGNIHIGGDLTVGTDSFYVDSTAGFVGVGKNNPSQAMDVQGTTTVTNIQIGGLSGLWAPIGAIGIWYGTLSNIPTGWEVCDGQTYSRSDGGGNITTPNLANYFIRGASPARPPGVTAGSNQVTLTANIMPAHTHSQFTATGTGAHNHYQVMSELDDGNFSGPTGQNPSGDAPTNRINQFYLIQARSSGHNHNFVYKGGGQEAGSPTHIGVDITPDYYAVAFIMKI